MTLFEIGKHLIHHAYMKWSDGRFYGETPEEHTARKWRDLTDKEIIDFYEYDMESLYHSIIIMRDYRWANYNAERLAEFVLPEMKRRNIKTYIVIPSVEGKLTAENRGKHMEEIFKFIGKFR